MDELLDELIELDSCTMDLGDEKADELKFMQEKTTFEYLPEWCHVIIPSFEHRGYLHAAANELKAEEESKKEKEKEEKEGGVVEEEKKAKDDETAHTNLYLYSPFREDSVEEEAEKAAEPGNTVTQETKDEPMDH
ncbi:unnamed protein product [Caenorhabditis sp. 36 PRJEB53466]|nr:unnamed protein product [Caenorhabditis sp. 36 PRJEB53466]